MSAGPRLITPNVDCLNTAPLPPVLPIVLHHGQGRWTAATEVAELAAPSGAFIALYQPAQRYFLLDVGEDDAGDHTDAPLPPGRNLVGALMRARQKGTLTDDRTIESMLT